MKSHQLSIWRKIVASFLLFTFLLSNGIAPVRYAQAQELFQLPQPGTRISLSPAFAPAILKGVKVYPDNPFRLDFILDKGNAHDSADQLKNESTRLIKYFLASLTTPDKDMWVNLSPYEKDRIVPDAFGQTQMGRDLLAQDYVLKQITASLMFPENEPGKSFWQRIYKEAYDKFGTTDIPVDTFNKIWIEPDKALVYEDKGIAFIGKSHLKVMLESDYFAENNNMDAKAPEDRTSSQGMVKQVIREGMIPIIEKEVNEGRNFSGLRQIYQSLILAAWYKKRLKESFLSQVYTDKNKIAGVNIDDPKELEQIWGQYVAGFKKGVYSYIKEEYDPNTQESIPRKYFSGGANVSKTIGILETEPLANAREDVSGDKGDFAEIKCLFKSQGTELEGKSDKAQMSIFELLDVPKESQVPLKIYSRDNELNGTLEATAPWASVREKDNIWAIIRSPLVDLNQIKVRQKFLRLLKDSGDLQAFIGLKNKIYLIREGITNLYEDVTLPIPNGPTFPLIEAFRRHGAYEKDVMKSLGKIEAGRQAMADLLQILEKQDDPLVKEMTLIFRQDLERLKKFDDKYFLEGPEYMYGDARREADTTYGRAKLFGSYVEIANVLSGDGFGEATFDPGAPQKYAQGWNILRQKMGQVLNDSTADAPVIVLSGSNAGGKSHYLAQSLFMQLCAQSFGFIPAQSGNFDVYDSFLFLDRADTESFDHLSAFGAEVKHIKEGLKEVRQKPFIQIDEGFSTTEEDDQDALQSALVEYWRKGGTARIFITLHNEKFIKRSAHNKDFLFYHFPFKEKDGKLQFDEKGDPVFSYLLTEGVGDSHALEILKRHGIPEDQLELAREYLDGDYKQVAPLQRQYPNVPATDNVLSEEGTAWDLPIFERKRGDWSFQDNDEMKERRNKARLFQTLPRDSAYYSIYTGDEEKEDRKLRFGSWEVDLRYRERFLRRLILQGNPLTLQGTLQRQHMFKALSSNDQYAKFKEVGEKLMWHLRNYPGIPSEGYLSMNKIFWEEASEHLERYPGKLTCVVALLQLNKKILGKDFPETAGLLLKRMEKMAALWKLMESEETEFAPEDIRGRELFAEALGVSVNEVPQVPRTDFFKFLEKTSAEIKHLENALPSRFLFEIDLDVVKDELMVLIDDMKESFKHTSHYYPDSLRIALALEVLIEKDQVKEWTGLLRQYHVPYLDSKADEFEDWISYTWNIRWEGDLLKQQEFYKKNKANIRRLVSDEEWAKINAEIASGDVSPTLTAVLGDVKSSHVLDKPVLSRFAVSHKALLHDYHMLEAALASYYDHPVLATGISAWQRERIETAVKDDVSDNIIDQVLDAYGQYFSREGEYQQIHPIHYKTQGEAKRLLFRDFYKEHIEGRGLLAQIRELDVKRNALFQQMEDFLKKYPSIRLIKSEDKTVTVGQIMKQVRESPDEMADILNIVVGKYFQYEMNGLQGGYGSWREDELNHEIMHVQALAWFGHMINTLKYAQVEFNNTGELDIKGMFNLSSSASDQKRNDAHFGKDEFIRFIEAPNMSGKSVYLETLSLLIACVTQTGYGPAEMINMPHFNRILSLARVASRLDRNSSALSSEVQLLKELLAVVTSGETVFVAATVDEPGSTTSKAYGSSMIYMLTMTALKHGQYLALASHDHDVSLVLEKLEKGYIKRHTMDTEITPDNTVKFNYILKPVEEGVKVSSEAIRVARSLGFPEEILQLAEEYKKTTDPSQVIKNPGGIDLNPTKLDLDIKGVKGAVDNAAVFTNMAWFENMTGLTPVILDTTQIVDLPAFLGLSK